MFPSLTSIIILWFSNQIFGFLLLNFSLSAIFLWGTSFIIFSAIDVSSQTVISLWFYSKFFLNSMAFGNLQRPIITSVSFSVIKTPSLISKNVLYFYFSYFVMSFVFLPQYFLIIFNPTSSIFECPSFVSISLILCHN